MVREMQTIAQMSHKCHWCMLIPQHKTSTYQGLFGLKAAVKTFLYASGLQTKALTHPLPLWAVQYVYWKFLKATIYVFPVWSMENGL